MALKFLDADGSGFTSDAVRAIDYAVANGATVSNNSWGGGGFSQSLYNAIARARAADHVFVAAAGNESINTDNNPHFPSSYDLGNILSVAASDRNDNLAWFSNYGAASVDLAAPGVSILSTFPGNAYDSFSGTSMATPHVAGAVALLQSRQPQWNHTQIIDQLLATVDPKAAFAGTTKSGGRLNVGRAVLNSGPDVTGPRVVSHSPAGSTTGTVSSVEVSFDETIDPATFTSVDVSGFRGPGGPLQVTSVEAVPGTNNQRFAVRFAPQSAFGEYSMTIGPLIADASGNLMDQDRDGVGGEAQQDQYGLSFTLNRQHVFPSTNVPRAIRDWETTRSVLTINQAIEIADLNVVLDIRHTWDGDLRIFLESPGGRRVVLAEFRGGSGDDFTNTVFDDEATVSISAGAAPFTGTYRPEQFLAAYDGQSAQGTWTLSIEDWYLQDQGTLDGWSLIVEAPAASYRDQLGVSRDSRYFYLDTTGNGRWDRVDGGDTFHDFDLASLQHVARPLVGDWDGDGDDDLGLYHNGYFYLDTTGNGAWDGVARGDTFRDFGINPIRATAVPVIGDWDGDGDDDLGLYNNGYFYLDTTSNGTWDGVAGGDTFRNFGLSGTPVVGNWAVPPPQATGEVHDGRSETRVVTAQARSQASVAPEFGTSIFAAIDWWANEFESQFSSHSTQPFEQRQGSSPGLIRTQVQGSAGGQGFTASIEARDFLFREIGRLGGPATDTFLDSLDGERAIEQELRSSLAASPFLYVEWLAELAVVRNSEWPE